MAIVLAAVERKIEQFVDSLDDAYVRSLYAKLPAGKRLRAKLILIIAGSSLSAVKLAAVVEMIHAASLLHDDVIDEAFTRRSKPSLNALYGNKTAIMLGDILYSKAFVELSALGGDVAQLVSQAVVELSQGELHDVALSDSYNLDKERYMKMIYQKTASLMEYSAGAAAVMANSDAKSYRKYGKNLGLAFQMIDDLLDITQDAATLGKPAMHDFKEGKMTLPYIYLHHALSHDDQQKLKSLHKKTLTKDEEEWIKQQMDAHGVIQQCKQEAKALIEEAVALMKAANEPELESIAMAMIQRSF